MNRIINTVIIIALSSINTMGAGTNYDVAVTNSATLSYDVGGVAQDVKNSNTDTFKVDRKVDVVVATTDATNIVVVPKINVASDTTPLTFTVTNQSNGIQDYILSASNLVSGSLTKDSGELDSVDFSSDLKICVDTTCSAGDISGNNIRFTEDEAKTYYIFADILNTASNGDRGSIALTATAVEDASTTLMTDDSGTVDNKTAVDVVFAEAAGDAVGDGQYDGKHSALSAYEVVSATLAVVKDSCVVEDGISATANAKRIPGATVRYTVNVANTGSADTASATLIDTLQVDLTYVSGEIRDTACNCGTPVGNVVTSDTVSVAGQVVTANFDVVIAGNTECLYITTTIN